jgi:alkylation response protein AidB-like acyl-CoA dehydrogenase
VRRSGKDCETRELDFRQIFIALVNFSDGFTVSAMNFQNTLVNTLFNKYGTEAQKAKYLPRLAQNTVRGRNSFSSDFFFFPPLFRKLMHILS